MTDYQNNLFCIPVHSRKQGQLIALVDRELSSVIQEYRWHLDRDGYARTKSSSGALWMHRLIVDVPDGHMVDHINGDTLNNTRANLRIVDNRLNQANKTPTLHAGLKASTETAKCRRCLRPASVGARNRSIWGCFGRSKKLLLPTMKRRSNCTVSMRG